MLLKFSVENYLSFKTRATLNFQAGSIKEKMENIFSPFLFEGPLLLKSIGIYGKNSSGKSNLIKAFSFMRDFIINSSKESQASEDIPVYPYRLSTETEYKPSLFEVTFFLDDIKYRYGFLVNTKQVESEWLFTTIKRKELTVFLRAGEGFHFEKRFSKELKGKLELLKEITRPNSLFISVLSQFNNELGLRINGWFNDILIAHDSDHLALIDFSAKLMTDVFYNKKLNEIIQQSDLGIESIQQRIKDIVQKKNYSTEFVTSFFSDNNDYLVKTKHSKYDQEKRPNEKVIFEMIENESLGTQKYFGLLGPILLALTQKRILWIDEVDARLHPILLENLIAFFNSKKFNPNGAQIIFTSHSTLPLKKLLRRDQMYFVEKDRYGCSTIDNLYTKDPKVRNDASFDKDYLSGKYGGIPRINSQLNLFDSSLKEESDN